MSETCESVELRQVACELARLGGECAGRLFGKVTVRRKVDNSPVTEADDVAQHTILRALADRYPDHAVLVEETVRDPNRHAELTASDYCWVIDPLDGTRNFARGGRVYACSVAVLHRGSPVAGAVYDATCGEVYAASLGGGAVRGEERLRFVDHVPGGDIIIALSSFRRKPMPPAVQVWMERYLTRNQGSTSLHFVWTAAGLIDAAFSNECKLWDIAAAALIIEEAGGVLTDDCGRSIWPIALDQYEGQDMQVIAASKELHRDLIATLREGAPR